MLTFRKRLSARFKDLANACRAWRHNYTVGSGTRIKRSASIQTGKTGSIVIGNNCSIHERVLFRAGGGSIKIGDFVSVNPFTTLDGQGALSIGNHVRIASHCAIVTSNHVFKDRNTPIRKQGLSRKGVVIEDDVWIGTHATILDGVRIAKGCIIGAGSVVTKSTKAFGVYVGTPAKRIRDR